MWRLNWIHPFTDGNGRTSRAVAYFVLCAKVGYRLPGHSTVPEQIAANKAPYYQALEKADQHWKDGRLDLSDLENLLDECLATQLLSAYDDAKNPDAGSGKERKLH
jgi:Fic family protein